MTECLFKDNVLVFMIDRLIGCFTPNTLMESGQGRPRTGELMRPLVRIQNPGPEKFKKGVLRGLIFLCFFASVSGCHDILSTNMKGQLDLYDISCW